MGMVKWKAVPCGVRGDAHNCPDDIERFHNPGQRHSKLAYLTPVEFEAKAVLA
jgi:hypothetical protein